MQVDGYGPALPPVSIAIAHIGTAYVEGLNAFRYDDLDTWIGVFAPAITLASDAPAGLAAELVDLRSAWSDRIAAARAAGGRQRPRSDSAVSASLEVLADMPAFRARDLAERLRVTWRAAQDAIVELVDAGIVAQVSAGRGNRLYEAGEVFVLLDRFEQDPAGLARRPRDLRHDRA